MMSSDVRESPGSLLASFAAAQFVVLVAMVGVSPRSIFTTLSIFTSSVALPFLLTCWIIVRDSQREQTEIKKWFGNFTLFPCFAGFLSILFMLLHYNWIAGLIFSVASIGAVIFGATYESRYKIKGGVGRPETA